MKLTVTEYIELEIDGDVRLVRPGEVFDLPDERVARARPYIERGLLKICREPDRIAELDRFFTVEIMPRLTRLHMAGRLPDLAACPLWSKVDELWGRPDPDPEAVKGAMIKALESYERK